MTAMLKRSMLDFDRLAAVLTALSLIAFAGGDGWVVSMCAELWVVINAFGVLMHLNSRGGDVHIALVRGLALMAALSLQKLERRGEWSSERSLVAVGAQLFAIIFTEYTAVWRSQEDVLKRREEWTADCIHDDVELDGLEDAGRGNRFMLNVIEEARREEGSNVEHRRVQDP
jgi:hypothetical protein